MRDAVDDNGIVDTEGFRKFLRACAAFSGRLLNYADLGSAAGVSERMVKGPSVNGHCVLAGTVFLK